MFKNTNNVQVIKACTSKYNGGTQLMTQTQLKLLLFAKLKAQVQEKEQRIDSLIVLKKDLHGVVLFSQPRFVTCCSTDKDRYFYS